MKYEAKDRDDPETSHDGTSNPMIQLEQAMCHCKFGRFHWRLLSAALAACFANNIVTANTSFLLPAAECHLHMDIMRKGLLNAVPFLGMITSGVFAGFLTDAFGRRMFLVGGYLGVFLSCIIEGSSQNYPMLVVGKFLEGVCLTIGFNPNMAIVSELTHKDIRDRVMLFFSTFKCISLVVVVSMSWVVLIQDWHFVIIQDVFELHTWSIYLYMCGIWSLLASVQYYFLPESPKYLLTQGKPNEALNILKRIYSENTGNPPDSFPVKSLSHSSLSTQISTGSVSAVKRLTRALFEIKSLFRRPLFSKLLMFSVITILNMLAYNTFRLWYPQISTIIETYTSAHDRTDSLCVMIQDYLNETVAIINNSNIVEVGLDIDTCVTHPSGSETYINGIIMGLSCLACHGVSGIVIGRCSQKTLIFFYLLLCSGCSLAMYWSNSSVQLVALVSTVVGFTQATSSLLFTMVVRVFPTTVRTLSVAIVTMIGRVGSVAGNLLFPMMLQYSCMLPFVIIAVITLCVALLVIMLPNPSKDNKDIGDY